MTPLELCWSILTLPIMVHSASRTYVPGPPSFLYVKNAMTGQVLRLDFADLLSVFTVKDLKDNIRRLTATQSYAIPRCQQIIFDGDEHLCDTVWLSRFTGDLSQVRSPNNPRVQLVYRFINVRVEMHRDKFIDVRVPNLIRMMNSSLDLIKEVLEWKLGVDADRQVIVYQNQELYDAMPLYNGNATVKVQLLIAS